MPEKNYIKELVNGECSDPKARIIKAALEEFGLRSFAGARTREIAAKANLNHAAISYYFGGKNELYMELARQIRDFIKEFSMPYFEKFAQLQASADSAAARNLALEFLGNRLDSEHIPDYLLRSIILIITREELYQTQIFGVFEGLFRAELEMLAGLISIASCGAVSGDRARIAAQMLIGQIHMFNLSRSWLWRVADLGDPNADLNSEVKKIVGEIFDKFVK